MDGLVTGLAAAAGVLLGDPLELLAQRTGAHRGLRRPWWSCPSCGRLPTAAAIPVVGALVRCRPCRWCQARRPLALRPVLLALVSGAVLGAMAARLGPDPVLPAFLVLGAALVAVSAVDLERLIIPNRIVYPAGAALAVLLVAGSAADGRWTALGWAAVGGGAAFGAFFAVHLAVPRGMGFGDVRLAALVGMATGWLSPGRVFVAFLLAFFIGAVVGLVVMAASGQGRRTRVPFGPFMATGCVLAVLVGGPLARVLLHHGS